MFHKELCLHLFTGYFIMFFHRTLSFHFTISLWTTTDASCFFSSRMNCLQKDSTFECYLTSTAADRCTMYLLNVRLRHYKIDMTNKIKNAYLILPRTTCFCFLGLFCSSFLSLWCGMAMLDILFCWRGKGRTHLDTEVRDGLWTACFVREFPTSKL